MYQDFARDLHLSAPRAAVWKVLLDVERVASWLPIVKDVQELEPLRRYSAVLEDRMGPFALRADLSIAVDALADVYRLRVSASGQDRQVASRIVAHIDLVVTDDAGGSALAVTGRYEVTGRVATLGAGAIRKKGERVLEDFMENLARELG